MARPLLMRIALPPEADRRPLNAVRDSTDTNGASLASATTDGANVCGRL
jgi:hypothetical protein